MKAAVLHEVNKPLVIEEVAINKPAAREVLIRTPGYATPTCISSRGFIRIRCRPCSATSPLGSSRRSAPTSIT